jgi:hypothetical protein
LLALYNIFIFNYEKSCRRGKAKQIILQKYPYTSYAEFVNPKAKISTNPLQMWKTICRCLQSLSDRKVFESTTMVDKAIADHPKDALVPKFIY